MDPQLDPWWSLWLADGGSWALAPVCFLAATVLPLSSEVAVIASLEAGAPSGEVLLWASLGNCLGAMTSYALGRWWSQPLVSKLTRSGGGRRAISWVERWGPLALGGSWLPIIGDPLMVMAGVFRMPAWAWGGLGLGTRVARYGVLILGFALPLS